MKKPSISTKFVNIFNLNVDSGGWYNETVVSVFFHNYKVAHLNSFDICILCILYSKFLYGMFKDLKCTLILWNNSPNLTLSFMSSFDHDVLSQQ